MSLFSWFTGTTPQSEQDANYAKLQALHDQRLQDRINAGTITDQQIQAQEANITPLDSETTAYGQGFNEGLQEGFQNVLAAPGKVVGFAGDSAGSVLWGVLKNIPWWVYLLAAAAGAVYFWPLLRPLFNRFARR